MTRLQAVALGALLAVGQAGCVLFDSRGALEIEPPGTLYALDVLTLEVKGPFQSFSVSFDGRDVDGTFPANQKAVVPAAHLATGEHRLVVTALDTAVPRSATRTLVVDKSPRLVSLDPPEGLVTTGEPFTVEATFSGPVFPTLAAGASPTLIGPAGPIPTRTSLLAGGSTMRIEIDQPVELVGPVSLTLSSGGTFTWHLGPWFAPTVWATITSPATDVVTNGTIEIAVQPSGPPTPPAFELLAGGSPVGELVPPGWSFQWDTATVPDGTYPLTLRARGYTISSNKRAITVDRTPPRVVSCRPEASPVDDARLWDCVRVTFDDVVSNAWPALLVGGVPRHLYYWSDGGSSVLICPDSWVALPAIQTIDLGPARDLAGNQILPFACPMNLRLWRRPCGSGPVALGGVNVVAKEIALDYAETGWHESLASTCGLLWVDPQGERLQAAVAKGPASWEQASAPATRSPAVTVTDPFHARPLTAWATYDPQDVAMWSESGRFVRSELDSYGVWSRPVPVGPPSATRFVPAGTANAVAWVEPTIQGGSVIRIQARPDTSHSWVTDAGPNGDPAAVADFPAIADRGWDGVLLAWLETPAGGGPAQLRAAEWDPITLAWSSVGESLNFDPATPAAEPSVWADFSVGARYLAWTEDGRVLLREIVRADSSPWAESVALPAEVMNADPGRVARTPRFLARTLVFVESGPSGDEIRTRWRDAAGWLLLDEIANAGVPGSVGRMTTSYTGGLAWIDEAGLVWVRALNQ